jgi:hypothetical protein
LLVVVFFAVYHRAINDVADAFHVYADEGFHGMMICLGVFVGNGGR